MCGRINDRAIDDATPTAHNKNGVKIVEEKKKRTGSFFSRAITQTGLSHEGLTHVKGASTGVSPSWGNNECICISPVLGAC